MLAHLLQSFITVRQTSSVCVHLFILQHQSVGKAHPKVNGLHAQTLVCIMLSASQANCFECCWQNSIFFWPFSLISAMCWARITVKSLPISTILNRSTLARTANKDCQCTRMHCGSLISVAACAAYKGYMGYKDGLLRETLADGS